MRALEPANETSRMQDRTRRGSSSGSAGDVVGIVPETVQLTREEQGKEGAQQQSKAQFARNQSLEC